MPSENGHGESRMDRIERTLDRMAKDHALIRADHIQFLERHEKFKQEHEMLMRQHERFMQSLERLWEGQDRLVEGQRQLLAAQVILTDDVRMLDVQVKELVKAQAESKKDWDERIGALIQVVDDFVRRPPQRPPQIN